MERSETIASLTTTDVLRRSMQHGAEQDANSSRKIGNEQAALQACSRCLAAEKLLELCVAIAVQRRTSAPDRRWLMKSATVVRSPSASGMRAVQPREARRLTSSSLRGVPSGLEASQSIRPS